MLERLESIEDEMNGVVTYRLPGNRMIKFDKRQLREYGLAKLLEAHDLGHLIGKERIKVMHHECMVGSVPADFEPCAIKSRTVFYDVRPGDFRRDGDVWVASRTLGPGDLDAVVGFVRE